MFIVQGAVDCDMMELGRMYRRVLHALKLEVVNFYLSFQAVGILFLFNLKLLNTVCCDIPK